jgi:NADH-quinone oxidoreductase subunit N
VSVADVAGLAPAAILLTGALVVAMFERVFPADERVKRWLAATIATAAALAAIVSGTASDAFDGAIRRDAAAVVFIVLIAGATVAALLLDAADPRSTDAWSPALMLGAAAGAVLVASAGDLVLLLFALEVSVAAQLATIARASRPGAGRAYFVWGASASVFVGIGVVLLVSASGTTALGALGAVDSTVARAGVALVLTGLACVAALAPFHLWLPSAAAGLSSATALFITTVLRIAALAALLRCAAAITSSSDAAVDWRACIAVLAAATVAVGAIAALTERSLRRLLAYLSVAYVGQIVVAAASGIGGSAAVALAIAVFVPLMVGAFAVVGSLPADDPTVDDLRGVARRRPVFAVALALLLFGLAGAPPTVGFFARLAIFESAVDAQLAWLMFVAAAATVASATTAARVAFTCLDAGAGGTLRSRTATALALGAAALVLIGGVVPGPLLELARGVRF